MLDEIIFTSKLNSFSTSENIHHRNYVCEIMLVVSGVVLVNRFYIQLKFKSVITSQIIYRFIVNKKRRKNKTENNKTFKRKIGFRQIQFLFKEIVHAHITCIYRSDSGMIEVVFQFSFTKPQ